MIASLLIPGANKPKLKKKNIERGIIIKAFLRYLINT
jgi:hypothetical protein